MESLGYTLRVSSISYTYCAAADPGLDTDPINVDDALFYDRLCAEIVCDDSSQRAPLFCFSYLSKYIYKYSLLLRKYCWGFIATALNIY